MNTPPETDVVLVGAGVMSATLAALLLELQPDLRIQIFESLPDIAAESSNVWNNAGTGHAALCELNYTPETGDGTIDTSKALKINEAYAISEQFWAYLVQKQRLQSPNHFINRVPHLSFVWGLENVDYLRRRFEALRGHHLFRGMQFSTEPGQLREWMPLVMQDRPVTQRLAATLMTGGTDIDFGALSRSLMASAQQRSGVKIFLQHRVCGLKREGSGWRVQVQDRKSGESRSVSTRFIFLGAGGGALPLLQKSGIPEGRTYGGFPVSGLWLRCNRPALIEKHFAKVYGKASVGAPPMSVPHLDTRIIQGQKALLFGPYAGFSTRFLKTGSLFDLPCSIRPGNLWPMLSAGAQNVELTKYLIGQVLQTPIQRLAALRDFLPEARLEDWDLEIAGQRVQVIKADPKGGGILQFGTEVICSRDGSLASLLGASPGASSAVAIMVDIVERCFPAQVKTPAWQARLREIIPSYGQSLASDPILAERLKTWTSETLGLS